jgi:hypothetical protein
MVALIVGEGEKHVFQMDQRTLCANSDLIAAECENASQTPMEALHFPNISVEICMLFFVWLSTGKLSGAKGFIVVSEGLPTLEPKVASIKLAQMIRCYHFAETLIARPFKNYMVDQISSYLGFLAQKFGLLERTIMLNIPLVYGYAPKESKLKCLLEDAIVFHGSSLVRCKLTTDPEVVPMVSGFWNGVAIAAFRERKNLLAAGNIMHVPYALREGCRYHEHVGNEGLNCSVEQFPGGI